MRKLFITVGTAAHELGISTEAIRAYERKGLITPIRDSQNRRLLTPADVQRIRKYRDGKRERTTQSVGI